jgi:hypothetical protein
MAGHERVAVEDNTYLLFAAGALAIALLAGFVLAFLLPVALLAQWQWGLTWQAVAQAHGHAQVMGWAGLFIFGMGYRLVPRFSRTPLRGRALIVPSFILLAAGVVLRLALQPQAGRPVAQLLLPLAGLAELAAVVLFVALTLPLLRRPLREGAGFAPYLGALDVWFVIQALLGAFWLWRDTRAGGMLLAPAHDQVILTLQFYGVLLTAIFGIALRAVPVFFGKPLPGVRAVLPGFALLHGGLAVYAVAAIWRAGGPGPALTAVETAALLAVAAGTVLPLPLIGAWLPASRLRPIVRNVALYIRAAFGWTAVAAALLAYSAIMALIEQRALYQYQSDAIRHVLALGVVTMMIAGMVFLVTPAFAILRQHGIRSEKSVWSIWIALMLATALRFLAGWVQAPAFIDARYWLMAVAAVLALTAIAVLAASLLRAARARPIAEPLPFLSPEQRR